MVSNDLRLPTAPTPDNLNLVVIAARNLDLSGKYIVDSAGIIDKQIAQQKVALAAGTPANILNVPNKILAPIIGRDHLPVGMIICDGLTFERRDSGEGKNLRLRSFHLDKAIVTGLNFLDFKRVVILHADARDRNIGANQKAFWRARPRRTKL